MLVKYYLIDNINVPFEEIPLAFQVLGPAWLNTIFKKDFGILMRVGMEGKRQLINFKLKKSRIIQVILRTNRTHWRAHTKDKKKELKKEEDSYIILIIIIKKKKKVNIETKSNPSCPKSNYS